MGPGGQEIHPLLTHGTDGVGDAKQKRKDSGLESYSGAMILIIGRILFENAL